MSKSKLQQRFLGEELTGDMKTDLEKYRVPRGPGGNPIRMGDKVRSMKGDQPLGKLKVKYGADKVREYYKKNRPVDEGVTAKYKGKNYKLLPAKVRATMSGKGGLDGDYRLETGKVKDWVTDKIGLTNTKRDGVKEAVLDEKKYPYGKATKKNPRGKKDQAELDRAQAYIKKNPNFGKKEVNEEASYKDFVKKAQDASARVKKAKLDKASANAKSAYNDKVTKGVKFYDKKGKGHIRDGKKVYS